MKKIVSFMLAFVLILSSFAGGAFTKNAGAAKEKEFHFVISGGAATITGYSGSAVDLKIPNTLGGVPVKRIKAFAFSGNRIMESVTLPNSLGNIEAGAFDDCKEFNRFAVNQDHPYFSCADGVLFNKSKSILCYYPPAKSGEYTIPNGVTTIGAFAFFNSPGLTKLNIPDSVTHIRENGILQCYKLTGLTIPSSVVMIGDVNFSGLDSLENLNVDANNPYYSSDGGVLYNKTKSVLIRCPGGKSNEYKIPDGVTAIQPRAFSLCTEIIKITLPDGLSNIGEGAFSDCWKLKEINIPEGVREVKAYTFSGCNNVGNFIIPDSVQTIGESAFYSCYAAKTITLGTGVKSLGDYAFSGCEGLTYINLPKGLKTIGDSAFDGCFLLKSIMIPDSVTSIGTEVFRLNDIGVRIIIQCNKDSYARKYAENHLISFQLIGKTIRYEVKFHKNSSQAAGEMENQKLVYGMVKNLTKNQFKRKGYTFMGWSTKKNGKGNSYENKEPVQTLTDINGATVHLYAKWLKNTKVGKVKNVKLSNPARKLLGVSFSKVPGAKGYKIVYSTNRKFKKDKKTYTTKKIINGITVRKNKKTYYVKVRAFKKRAGKRIYSKKFSPVKKIKLLR